MGSLTYATTHDAVSHTQPGSTSRSPSCALHLTHQLLVVAPPGSWRYEWVNALLSECAALFIYANFGLVLRPLDAYIYTRVRASCVLCLVSCVVNVG